ncbi:bola protein [Parasitella parasitica]|nr:bola protein [Parasitella parasitica]
MSNDSGVTADGLKKTISDKLKATHVVVEDLSAGCGQMFEVIIVSPLFEDKRLLTRHKLVNEALKEEISKVHAFTQKSYTPEEWAKKNAE